MRSLDFNISATFTVDRLQGHLPALWPVLFAPCKVSAIVGQEPGAQFRGRRTLDPGPWTLDPGPWTLDPGPWTLDPGSWTLAAILMVPGS